MKAYLFCFCFWSALGQKRQLPPQKKNTEKGMPCEMLQEVFGDCGQKIIPTMSAITSASMDKLFPKDVKQIRYKSSPNLLGCLYQSKLTSAPKLYQARA